MTNKYSILSVDSNPDYLFFVPITCAFWKQLDYQPYVILIDKGISKEMKSLILEETDKIGGHINLFEHIEGYRTCNVAQVSRLYAASDPYFSDDDYLMTDDMDKFVISYMWFNQQNMNKDIHIYDPDELNYKRLKIGNIGMKAKVWKEVIGFGEGSVRENLIKCFDKHLSKDSDWDTGWNIDEWILTNGVFKSRYYPDNCQMFERGGNRYGMRNGRIDRGAWKQTFNSYINTNLIDVHLNRKPYEQEIWEDIKIIMSKVFSQNQIKLFDDYRNKFMELL